MTTMQSIDYFKASNWPVDLKGRPVPRTKKEFPYNYDEFVVWKNPAYQPDGQYGTAYSDRMYQMDDNKYDVCSKKVWGKKVQAFFNCSPSEIKTFLAAYFEFPIILMAVLECCNHATGYPYWTFIYEKI